MRIHHDVDLHTHTQSLALTDSVTRFGEILSLNHNNKNLWPFSRIQIEFGKVLSLLWPILFAIGQILIVENGKILK